VHDRARRRQSIRRGNERGAWVYVPGELLVELGIDLEAPAPLYRTWAGRKRSVLVQLYPQPVAQVTA
jgi:hypothetical protein